MCTKTRILVGALSLVCSAFAADKSDALFLYVNPERSSFWHTAESNELTLPVNYPEGATKATLTVTGVRYSQVYDNITTATYDLTLPAATAAQEENTYALTLSFDAGDPQTATVSVVSGLLPGGAGSTRCVSDWARAWAKMTEPRMTLPVPYGTTSLTKAGEPVDTGLYGAQGFCTLPSEEGTYVLTVGETQYSATLVLPKGMTVVVR